MKTNLASRIKLSAIGAAIIAGFILNGCSGTQVLSNELNQTKTNARDIVDELAAAKATGEVGPAAQPHLDTATSKAVAIGKSADRGLAVIPKITDATPLWYPLVKWGLILGGVLATLGLGIYLNIGALARPAFAMLGGWISWLVPREKVTEAKLDAEAFASGRVSPEQDKNVTLRRASDPAYNLAFEQAKKEIKSHA